MGQFLFEAADENARGTAQGMLLQLLGGKSGDRGGDLLVQSLETRVHEGYLPFRFFRLECCATTKPINVIPGRMPMKTASLAHTEPIARSAEMLGTALRTSRNQRSQQPCGWRGTLRRHCGAALLVALLALLSACSSESSKPEETAKPEAKGPELITGRSAFQKVYIAARGWKPDAKPYRLEATATSDGNGHDGKWAVWRGSFASVIQRSVKSYTWSGSAADGAPARGVNPGIEDSYSPSNSSTQVFDIAFLKIDSDQALETAQKHGGDKVLEKAPDTPVIYICDWNHNTNELIWHVVYGSNREGAKLTVAVNASTGEFIRVEK
jgi:hypothetical protein